MNQKLPLEFLKRKEFILYSYSQERESTRVNDISNSCKFLQIFVRTITRGIHFETKNPGTPGRTIFFLVIRRLTRPSLSTFLGTTVHMKKRLLSKTIWRSVTSFREVETFLQLDRFKIWFNPTEFRNIRSHGFKNTLWHQE